MGIKEKELEDLILDLLDKSSAIQKKVRSICDVSQNTSSKSGWFDRKNSAHDIDQLKSQLNQCKNDYQNAMENAKEYKNKAEQLQAKCIRLESNNQNLEDQTIDLKKSLERAKTETAGYVKQLNDMERKYEDLKEHERELSVSLDKANKFVKILKDRFSEPVLLLDRYKNLSISVRTGLSDIICDRDEILFIASCSTPEHLKAIWTYTKKLAGNNGDTEEFEILKNIFDYFFEVFNNLLNEPMYVRDDVEEGFLFDDDKYDRYTGSATSGRITKVVLKGYRSLNTGMTICRSLVCV